jgi:hypothetical protein
MQRATPSLGIPSGAATLARLGKLRAGRSRPGWRETQPRTGIKVARTHALQGCTHRPRSYPYLHRTTLLYRSIAARNRNGRCNQAADLRLNLAQPRGQLGNGSGYKPHGNKASGRPLSPVTEDGRREPAARGQQRRRRRALFVAADAAGRPCRPHRCVRWPALWYRCVCQLCHSRCRLSPS